MEIKPKNNLLTLNQILNHTGYRSIIWLVFICENLLRRKKMWNSISYLFNRIINYLARDTIILFLVGARSIAFKTVIIITPPPLHCESK